MSLKAPYGAFFIPKTLYKLLFLNIIFKSIMNLNNLRICTINAIIRHY